MGKRFSNTTMLCSRVVLSHVFKCKLFRDTATAGVAWRRRRHFIQSLTGESWRMVVSVRSGPVEIIPTIVPHNSSTRRT